MEHPYAHILRAIADGKPIQLKAEGAWIDKDHALALALISSELCTQEGIRVKPRTIEINGCAVPEPLRVEPEKGRAVYAVDLLAQKSTATFGWTGSDDERVLLQRGVLHLTKEACRAHVHALISVSRKTQE